MKKQTKTLMALASVCLLVATGGAMAISNADEALAADQTYNLSADSVVRGESYSKSLTGQGLMNESYYTVLGADWISLTRVSQGELEVTGTPTNVGIYNVKVTGPIIQGGLIAEWNWTVNVNEIFTISFDSMDGSPVQSIERVSGEQYGDLPTPTKEGYDFAGWYYTEWDSAITGPVGSSWTAYMDLTMWAKWTPLLEVPYTAPSGSAVANVNWSYTPTSESGVTVTVSGVDWLSVNGTSVYGAPPAPGEYTITIGMSKPGYSDRTETIVLNVVSELIVFNSPLSGAIIYGL